MKPSNVLLHTGTRAKAAGGGAHHSTMENIRNWYAATFKYEAGEVRDDGATGGGGGEGGVGMSRPWGGPPVLIVLEELQSFDMGVLNDLVRVAYA